MLTWLALAAILAAAFGIAWNAVLKLRDERWAHQEETRLLRKRLDEIQSQATRLMTDQTEEMRGANLHIEKLEILLKLRDGDLAAAKTLVAETEATLERTREALADTEERLRFWMATAEKLDARYERANADAIEAREIIADWVAQRTFGRSIFHKAPPLPAESLHRKPIPRARIQGRLAVQLADAAFARQEAELRRGGSAGGPPATAPAEPVRIEVTPDPNP